MVVVVVAVAIVEEIVVVVAAAVVAIVVSGSSSSSSFVYSFRRNICWSNYAYTTHSDGPSLSSSCLRPAMRPGARLLAERCGRALPDTPTATIVTPCYTISGASRRAIMSSCSRHFLNTSWTRVGGPKVTVSPVSGSLNECPDS